MSKKKHSEMSVATTKETDGSSRGWEREREQAAGSKSTRDGTDCTDHTNLIDGNKVVPQK